MKAGKVRVQRRRREDVNELTTFYISLVAPEGHTLFAVTHSDQIE